MSSTNHKIRVIKREQRERRLRQEEEASDLAPQTKGEMPEAKEREPVLAVVEWINEYRARQHRSNEESYKKMFEKTLTHVAAE